MSTEDRRRRFAQVVMPHFDAAYNLARWLMRNKHDAQDATQEAMVRAITYLDGLRGDDAKAWTLAIVRNICITHLSRRRSSREEEFDETLHGEAAETASSSDSNPERIALREASAKLIRLALLRVPADVREVLILRELEELSYKEISEIVSAPIGTVMSRLHRGRRLLREALQHLDATLRPVRPRRSASMR